MPRYRHYRNLGRGNDTVFVTTTCLDFAHVFARDAIKTKLALRVAHNHIHYGAILHAYVVMANHLHFVTTLPDGKAAGWFIQRIKTNTSKELLPLMSPDERRLLDLQRNLDRRQLWQRSFRSIVLDNDGAFWQKVDYVHENPMRAGLAGRVDAYPWSSGALLERGLWSEETGLAPAVLESFAGP